MKKLTVILFVVALVALTTNVYADTGNLKEYPQLAKAQNLQAPECNVNMATETTLENSGTATLLVGESIIANTGNIAQIEAATKEDLMSNLQPPTAVLLANDDTGQISETTVAVCVSKSKFEMNINAMQIENVANMSISSSIGIIPETKEGASKLIDKGVLICYLESNATACSVMAKLRNVAGTVKNIEESSQV